jgi:tartrate dehydratase beta subunit/fumarate hydratase class I family protein
MKPIRQEDFVQSVADAFQFISCYHPVEAIREFVVKDMPVTVAVDSRGEAVHRKGPAEWRARIGKIPVAVA